MVSTRRARQSIDPGGPVERVAIIGAGAWGTTLALVAHRAGRAVTLVTHRSELASHLIARRAHPASLPGVRIPEDIDVTVDVPAAVRSADVVIVAVPAQSLRAALTPYALNLSGTPMISAVKGLELDTLHRPTEVIAEIVQQVSGGALCALSGPNLASEIARGQPATTVIASKDTAIALAVQAALSSSTFRVYVSNDIVGAEMGGALKNIIAIGAGICDGMRAGDNAKAAFLTRGISEIARLGIACGADALTFAGLTGIGDVIATCSSPLSRNHRVGQALAGGKSLPEVLDAMGEVAEGVPTTRAAHQLGRRMGIELPIIDQTYEVLFRGKSPVAAIESLMDREAGREYAPPL